MSPTRHQVSMAVELPDVVEEPRCTVVRCGQSSVEVKEHGRVDSGDWAAWSNGHVIGQGGKVGYPRERALEDARRHVREAELSRLFRTALVDHLNLLIKPDPDDD